MGEKFLGMGLKKFLSLGVAIIVFIVAMKVIVNKYPVPGVSDIVNAV